MVREAQKTEVIPGVHQLKIPIRLSPLHLNSYLIMGDKGCLLVDTGLNTEAAFEALTEQLTAIGVTLQDIAQIVITHVHADHYGLAGRLKQMCSAKFAFHLWERAFIESRYVHLHELVSLQTKMGDFLVANGVPGEVAVPLQTWPMPVLDLVSVALPDEVLYGGEIFTVGEFELEVLWTPGHTPGHVCLYEANKKFLIAGDHILPRVTPNISYHLQSGSNPLGDYINSARLLEPLDVEMVLPGHEHIFGNMKGRIGEILQHHEEREAEILALLAEGPMTAYQIAEKLPWNVADGDWTRLELHQQRNAVTETISHLEYLRLTAQLRRTTRDGIKYYGLPPVEV